MQPGNKYVVDNSEAVNRDCCFPSIVYGLCVCCYEFYLLEKFQFL